MAAFLKMCTLPVSVYVGKLLSSDASRHGNRLHERMRTLVFPEGDLEMASLSLTSLLLLQYPAALMNLGAILHLNGRLQKAEANYLRALQLKPDDVITQSNLRKLWNIMEKQGLKTSKT